MLMERNKIIKPNKVISSTPVLFKEKSQKCIFSFVPFTKTLIVLLFLQQILLNNDSLFWLHLHVLTPLQILCVGETGLQCNPYIPLYFFKGINIKKRAFTIINKNSVSPSLATYPSVAVDKLPKFNWT